MRLRKFLNEIKDYTKKPKRKVDRLPRFIYHVTSISNLEDIRKNGLIPKFELFSGEYNRPKGIYFTTEKYKAHNIMSIFKFSKRYDLNEMVVLTIDTKGMKNTFYHDPEYLPEEKSTYIYRYNCISKIYWKCDIYEEGME